MTDRPGAVLRESRSRLPSVDRLARHADLQEAIARYGRDVVIESIRAVLHSLRMAPPAQPLPDEALALQAAAHAAQWMQPSLRPVLNLTGTVLHTNLGRAPLPRKRWRPSRPWPAAAATSSSIWSVAHGGSGMTMSVNGCVD